MNVQHMRLARHYAQAFVTVFGMHDEWVEDMQSLIALFKNKKSLLILLTLPNVPVEQKIAVLKKFFAKLSCFYALERLFVLLIAHAHIMLMSAVLEEIVACYHEQRGVTACLVDSSHIVQEEDKQTIQVYIQHAIKRKAQCTFRVKPQLIAGIRIQASTFFWQYSIRAQLQALRTTLMR